LSSEPPKGWVQEIFASIQGEGLYCGRRQTFVRFAGCNLDCDYCDTPAARDPQPALCRIETGPASGKLDETLNPIDAAAVVSACARLGSDTVTITGGEPLVQPEFLLDLACKLRQGGYRIHLETNGTLPSQLEQVIKWIDVVAMDMKLPSAAGLEAQWATHAEFLKAASSTEVFVKAVVSDNTGEDEIRTCAQITAGVDGSIPLVIQPAWGKPINGVTLVRLQQAALDKLADVRVIPQCHRILGLL